MTQRPGFLFFAATAAAVAGLMGGCSKPAEPVVPPPPSTVAAASLPDMDVSANVKKALQANDMLKTADIGVVTTKGDVQLTGMLDSQAQIDEALKTARTATGVMTLKNDLTIKK